MNTTEIRALVAKKIAGQGMMVDAGASLQPIIESLCDIIDALDAQLANVKTYTAGDGIGISEQGLIDNKLVYSLEDMGISFDPIEVTELFVKKLIDYTAVKLYGGHYLTSQPVAGSLFPDLGTIYAFFGSVNYVGGHINSATGVIVYRGNDDKFYISEIEN